MCVNISEYSLSGYKNVACKEEATAGAPACVDSIRLYNDAPSPQGSNMPDPKTLGLQWIPFSDQLLNTNLYGRGTFSLDQGVGNNFVETKYSRRRAWPSDTALPHGSFAADEEGIMKPRKNKFFDDKGHRRGVYQDEQKADSAQIPDSAHNCEVNLKPVLGLSVC